MKKLLTACAMSLVLTACGGVSGTSGVTSAKKETGLFGVEKEAVSVDTAKAFAGTKDVVIGGFLIGYDIKSSASNKAGGGLMGSGFGGKSSAKMELTGVSNDTLQKVTDAAYADFVADLKAQGYNVVDRSSLINSKEFSGTNKKPNPFISTGGGILTAAAETRYFAPSSFDGVRFFMGDVQGETGGFGSSNPSMGATEFSAKAGNPRVIHVRYVLDFANADGHGSWASSTSSLQVGQGLSVAAGSSLGIIGGQMGTFSTNVGKITLGQPVGSDKTFGEVVDTTTDGHKVAEVATNIIGTLGGIGSNSSKHFEVKADSAKFTAAAQEAIGKTNDTLVGKMGSLK